MSMTAEKAVAAVKEHRSQRAAAKALGVSRSCLQGWLRKAGGSPQVKTTVKPQPAQTHVSPASGGFSLEGKRVLAQKPTDTWKARFYALRRNMGYTIEHLSEEWGHSADTIKSKAKALDALRYVENPSRPGEYLVCAVHPETPKGK